MATDQLLIRIEQDLADQIREDADRYQMKSMNSIASEILTLYYPLWRATKEAQFAILERQYKEQDLTLKALRPGSKK